MRWYPRGYGGERRDPERVKREDWREQGLLAVSMDDDRLSWPERELVRQLGEKLYGRREEGSDARGDCRREPRGRRLQRAITDHLGQGRLVLSRGDYHWQHEPCWYAVKKTGKGHWAGDRKQTTLWQISGRDQDAETVHGTQKPVECMRRPILNNSSPGQAVYEPFMGSGTTLIAAETTGRVCLGIELNSAYVDVAVDRWQQFSGKIAVLDGDCRTFAEFRKERIGSGADPEASPDDVAA